MSSRIHIQEQTRKSSKGSIVSPDGILLNFKVVFDAIPPIFELEDAIEEAIQQKRSNQMR
jgi:hypothetical protein